MNSSPPERRSDRSPDESERPPVTLGDPRVGEVPDTTPRPGEEAAEAAARIAGDADGEQDAWGAPEDQPDHEGNEVYLQRDEPEP